MGYFDKFNSGKGIPFMDGAEKGEMKDILGENVHIDDFGFIRNDEGDFAVIQLREYPNMFFFCNQVITDMLHEVDKDGMRGELPSQIIRFSSKTSKKGRDYFAFEFAGGQDELPFD